MSNFDVVETTIEAVHKAFQSGQLTPRELVQAYIDRIEAYDKKGPALNCVITVNPNALEEADRLGASPLTGPLHGIPIVFKDQGDAKGMPTTLGSVLFKDYYPDRDCFVVEQLKKAGAIILAKATLGELGGGDTHGSLFGSSRNPYDVRAHGGRFLRRVRRRRGRQLRHGCRGAGRLRLHPPALHLELRRRHAAPRPGLVSRGGVYDGWPDMTGSLGPMSRTVGDMARLLDAMVGYDPEDPVTARGVGHIPPSYTDFLDAGGLRGARLGILREPMGFMAEPDTDDFRQITEVFDKAVADLQAAGAEVVDPVEIPQLNELLAKRSWNPTNADKAFKLYYGRSAKRPFESKRGGHGVTGVRQGPLQRPEPVEGALGRGQALRVPAGARNAHGQPVEGHGRPPARRHRTQVGGSTSPRSSPRV